MVRTRQTASLQLSQTPWTLRRKRKIWRAKRIKAAPSSTGCSEPWSKKLRQPCDDGYCWKGQHINWGIPEWRSRTLPWTPTTVRWRAFSRAFRKAFRTSPSIYRRMRDPHFHLPASNKIHFFAPGSSTKGGKDMDLFDRFAGNDSWHTRRLLEYAGTLTEEQLDRPLPTVVELLPWRESNKTLRQLLENIIFTKEVWTAALSGAEMDMNGAPQSQRSPQAMLQRLEKTDAELHRIFSDIRNRSAWDDTFVDALCEPAETFTFGGVFAHIVTFNAPRRLMALDALRQLGVQTEGFGDPMEYEESVAPCNQQVPLKTP